MFFGVDKFGMRVGYEGYIIMWFNSLYIIFKLYKIKLGFLFVFIELKFIIINWVINEYLFVFS